MAGASRGLLSLIDQIVLPFRFIADGEPMPDLSEYRDPIILRARWKPTERTAPPAPTATAVDQTSESWSVEDTDRLRQADPPIEAVYPEAWLLGGLTAARLGLHVLRAVARRVLSPEPGRPTATADAAVDVPGSPDLPARPTEPIALEQFHIAPRQIQRKLKHAKTFGVSGNWSPENGRKFAEAVREFVRKPGVVRIEGQYHRKNATIFYESATSRAMIFDRNGEFISGWELSPMKRFHLFRDARL